MATITVLDSTGATQTVQVPNPNGVATSANSKSVVIASDQAAVPVSNASLPLPIGAATETTLAGQSAKLPATVGQKAMAASLAVVIASDQSAVPISSTALTTIAANSTLTTFNNDSVTPLTSSSTFTGSARDVGVAAGAVVGVGYFNGFFLADQSGTARIDCSNDNATWYTGATAPLVASTPLILTVPVMTRYHRIVLVNSTVAQSTLKINTSYTGS
jgi:hypothetical protein